MNALISGRAGVALLVEGDGIYSMHADAPYNLIARRAEEFWHLFGDPGDFEVVDEADAAAVEDRLLAAANGQDVLDLTLILLDPDLSHETRAGAAEDLDLLLAQADAAERAESYLFAHPLPPQADLAGALASCASQFFNSERFLRRLEQLQSAIREVRVAFESALYLVSPATFPHGDLRSIAAHRGLFRELVLAVAGEESLAPDNLRGVHILEECNVPDARRFVERWLLQLRLPSHSGDRAGDAPVTLEALMAAKKLVTELGSVEAAKTAIDALRDFSPDVDRASLHG